MLDFFSTGGEGGSSHSHHLISIYQLNFGQNHREYGHSGNISMGKGGSLFQYPFSIYHQKLRFFVRTRIFFVWPKINKLSKQMFTYRVFPKGGGIKVGQVRKISTLFWFLFDRPSPLYLHLNFHNFLWSGLSQKMTMMLFEVRSVETTMTSTSAGSIATIISYFILFFQGRAMQLLFW